MLFLRSGTVGKIAGYAFSAYRAEVLRSLLGEPIVLPFTDVVDREFKPQKMGRPVKTLDVVPVAEGDRPPVVLHLAANRGAVLVVAQVVRLARVTATWDAARARAKPGQVLGIGMLAAVTELARALADGVSGFEAGVASQRSALHSTYPSRTASLMAALANRSQAVRSLAE